MVKQKSKYDDEWHVNSTKRIAKCGHPTKEGRYFQCENCKPNLEEETDWNYFDSIDDDMGGE